MNIADAEGVSPLTHANSGYAEMWSCWRRRERSNSRGLRLLSPRLIHLIA